MSLIFTYLFYFIIYSIIGWIVETSYVYISTKKFVDRGFLVGPYCPIYGSGAVLMILYLTQYKDNILTVFILSTVICSILEYLTSYIMEVLFKTRWWDYSTQKFNLNGRICGKNSLLFGLAGILVIYIIHPVINRLTNKIPNTIFIIIAVIMLIIFISDLILSLNVVSKFKKTLTSIDLKKDSTIEFTKVVKDVLRRKNKRLEERLFKAFPNINLNNLIKIKNDILELKDEIIDKIKKD